MKSSFENSSSGSSGGSKLSTRRDNILQTVIPFSFTVCFKSVISFNQSTPSSAHSLLILLQVRHAIQVFDEMPDALNYIFFRHELKFRFFSSRR
ncbi:unnamed protein product [Lactuca virosa]|uniref:Uncharacterized protein n=1 Tax=Lactuca virosa TaxID=75947 RepID=A0AAU9MDW6_9ASTR|nr:unnamed protein product [Lactuca virosa]